MNTFNRRASTVLFLGLFGTSLANAIEPAAAAPQAENGSCHMQMRRVAVWPHGPWKGLQTPRYEQRMRLMCDPAKAVSKPVRSGQRTARGE